MKTNEIETETSNTTQGNTPRPTKSKRRQILEIAATLIDGQRAEDYGDASESFARIGRMWTEILHLSQDELITAPQVALMMMALKMSRLSESIDHEDSWIDAAGYAALGGESALGTERVGQSEFQSEF